MSVTVVSVAVMYVLVGGGCFSRIPRDISGKYMFFSLVFFIVVMSSWTSNFAVVLLALETISVLLITSNRCPASNIVMIFGLGFSQKWSEKLKSQFASSRRSLTICFMQLQNKIDQCREVN